MQGITERKTVLAMKAGQAGRKLANMLHREVGENLIWPVQSSPGLQPGGASARSDRSGHPNSMSTFWVGGFDAVREAPVSVEYASLNPLDVVPGRYQQVVPGELIATQIAEATATLRIVPAVT